MLTNVDKAEHPKVQRTLEVALLPIIICVVIIIGGLVFSNNAPSDSFFHRSEYYWHRLLWLCIIISTGYLSLFGWVLPQLLKRRQQTGAGYIGMAGTICQASFMSLILWCVGIALPVNYIIWEICCQIIILVVCMAKAYFLFMAQRLQNDGMALIPENVKNSDELCVFLKVIEESSPRPESQKKIKKLREYIMYSLPRVGRISTVKNYVVLQQLILELYDNQTRIVPDDNHQCEMDEALDKIEATIKLLKAELLH